MRKVGALRFRDTHSSAMGHRANLVIIDGSTPELYYSQWRASSLDADLFWGPSYATAFVRSQIRQSGPFELLRAEWAEGGAVIDHGRRTVVWYGGDEIRYDVPRRRLHLRLMCGLWPGWTVRWASEGVVDIADYLGIHKNAVMGTIAPPRSDKSWSFEAVQDASWNSTIISSVRDGQLAFAATDYSVVELLNVGYPLLAGIQTAAISSRFDWSELGAQFPTGGIHLDWDEHRLCYWIAEDAPDLGERVRALFPDWPITLWGDRFEAQVEAGAGALLLPTPDSVELLQGLQAYLLGDAAGFGDPVSSIISRLEDNDGIVVPSDARITQVAPPEHERQRLLASVIPAPSEP